MSVTARAHEVRSDRVSSVTTAPVVSSTRLRRAARASAAMAAGSAASFVVSAAIVPLTIGYLGVDRFGVWMATAALVALLEPFDLGVGSALVTRLAGADRRAAALVRAATRWLVGCGLAMATAAVVLSFGFDLGVVVNASESTARSEALPTIAVLVAGFCLGLPLSVVDRIHLALQEGHRVGVTAMVGHGLSFTFVLVAALTRSGVPVLAAALIAGPLIARAWALIGLRRRRPDLFVGPRALSVDATVAARRDLLSTGGLFFGLQVVVAVAFGADQVVISRVLGAEAVPEYAVPARLFALVSAGALLVARPLWPAHAEAAARGDGAWAVRVLRRSCGLVVAGALLLVVPLVIAGPSLLEHFARDRITPSIGVLVAFAAWTVLNAWGAPVAAFLNGVGIVRMQLVASSAMAVTNLVLSIVLARRIGVAGVVWGSVISYTACIVVPYTFLLPRVARRLEERS